MSPQGKEGSSMTKILLAVATLALPLGGCLPVTPTRERGRWKCELQRLGNKVQTEVCRREP
jgi:hypothetical protein